jgi:hypothetical protein
MTTAANLIKRMQPMPISSKLAQCYSRPDERPRCKTCRYINNPQAAIPRCFLPGAGDFSVSQWGFCDHYQPAIK